jgi:branched-chain amino acid transport system permease protein
MGLVNFAHGDMLMMGMYVTYWIWFFFSIDPIMAVPITGVVMFGFGMLIYYMITRKVLRAQRYAQIFATFGLSIFLRAIAQFFFTPNYRMIDKPLLGSVARIGDISIGLAQLVAGLVAFVLAIGVYLLIRKTDLGRALSATSEDKSTAEIMGINSGKMFAIGWGIAGGCVGIAGALMTSYYYVYPDVGVMFSTLAPAIVALGGFGSIPGTLVAACLMGIVQTTASFYISSSLKLAIVYIVYIAIVAMKPSGLMGRW